jgi:HEPN domain-containing protein
MIEIRKMRVTARARLNDAIALLRARRYDGAVYVCGYAVEIALKARICKHLKWPGYPESSREFQSFQSFKTHNFDTLLALTGIELIVRSKHLVEWSTVTEWEPELRYREAGTATQQDAELMIDAARTLLSKL